MNRTAIVLAALLATFLGQPLSRSLNRLIIDGFNEWAILGFLLLGFLGIVVVATQLKAPDMQASIAGYIAGILMWRGFFDGPLRSFGDYFEIAPIDFGGFPLSGRYALLMSTLPMMIAVLVLYGMMNRETKCNFMRFTLRLIRWSPGTPTANLQRSVARIAALETIFVQWAIFLMFLYLGGALSNPFYLVMLAWSAYLLYQLLKRRGPAEAFRYAIPVSVIIFSLAEVGAFFGLYPEIWQAPSQYPISTLIMVLIFIATIFLLIAASTEKALSK